MKITEDQVNEKFAIECSHCVRNMSLPYEYEYTCISRRHNVVKRKYELSKIQRQRKYFNRLNFAGNKLFCICINVYKNEGDDYDNVYETLSKLRTEKCKQCLHEKI